MAIGLCLLGTPAAADTLPLPQNLIDFTSEQGEHLLLNAEAKAAYWPLAAQFVTQEHQAYCGVASLVMVMNALRIPAPTTPEFTPYSAFTQGDFLNDATEKILPRAVLAKQGMTVDQIARLAETYPVRAEIHHASDTDLDEFRTMEAISSRRTTSSWLTIFVELSARNVAGISPLATARPFLRRQRSRAGRPHRGVRQDTGHIGQRERADAGTQICDAAIGRIHHDHAARKPGL